MNIPYLSKKVKEVIFGDDKEVNVKDFKERSAKLRLGGNEWIQFSKDLESLDIINVKGRKIKLEK